MLQDKKWQSDVKEHENMGKIKLTPCYIKGLYFIEPSVFLVFFVSMSDTHDCYYNTEHSHDDTDNPNNNP